MKRRAAITGLLAVLTTWAERSDADGEVLLVLVHKVNPVGRLDRSELSQFFLTKRRTWPSGEPVEPVNLPVESSARRLFDEAVHHFTPEEAARYWIDRKIRGGAQPPQRLSTAAAVVQFVADERGAIGYIPAGSASQGTKVVARIVNGRVEAP